MVVKRLVESHLDKISRTKLRHKKAAWSLGTVPNAGNDVQQF